jgi:hypothetical protein
MKLGRMEQWLSEEAVLPDSNDRTRCFSTRALGDCMETRGVDIFSVPALTSRQGFREGLPAYLPGNKRFLDHKALSGIQNKIN